MVLPPNPWDPEDSPPSRRLSRRSPLRSADSTAAPEGQTKFDLGKRARGAIMEISVGCTRRGKPRQPSVPGARPPSTRRTNRRAACTWPPLKSRKLGGGGDSGRERVPEVKPAPGLSLRAQNPKDPAPSRRPPSSKGALGDPRGGGRQAEKGSEMDSKASGSQPGGFRLRLLFPVPSTTSSPSHLPKRTS